MLNPGLGHRAVLPPSPGQGKGFNPTAGEAVSGHLTSLGSAKGGC